MANGSIDLADVDCAELAPALARFVRPISPGACVVLSTARLAAAEGIRAWCRLTGHVLEREEVHGDATLFTIRRKAVAP